MPRTKNSLDISPIPRLVFTGGGVKKCNIWPLLFIPVALVSKGIVQSHLITYDS